MCVCLSVCLSVCEPVCPKTWIWHRATKFGRTAIHWEENCVRCLYFSFRRPQHGDLFFQRRVRAGCIHCERFWLHSAIYIDHNTDTSPVITCTKSHLYRYIMTSSFTPTHIYYAVSKDVNISRHYNVNRWFIAVSRCIASMTPLSAGVVVVAAFLLVIGTTGRLAMSKPRTHTRQHRRSLFARDH